MIKITRTSTELEALYLADNRVWVVAFSGGKDSTTLLQLVFEMLIKLGEKANKSVVVISSDTQVELPDITNYLATMLQQIDAAAQTLNIPVSTQLVRPLPTESFWSKLIGKGYTPPSRLFRWCTSNLKIKPSRRVIDELTRNHGSVILLLGARIAESSQRGKTMRARDVNSSGLNVHHEIHNVLVANPIAEWTTDEVWEYLTTNACPWGGNHNDLFSLYRQASGGECPVIFDLNAPSCGGSRFGCWTCTVVNEDKSLQGLIRSGKDHLQPLADFRNWLIELRDKPGYRSDVRRNKTPGPGPFLPKARQEILEALLKLEQQMRLLIISDAELAAIQDEWSKEFDFQKHLANKIAAKYGRRANMQKNIKQSILPEIELLEQAAIEAGINPELLKEALDIRRIQFPSLDKYGAKGKFEQALGELVEKAVNQAKQVI